jgi:hypothetical protein
MYAQYFHHSSAQKLIMYIAQTILKAVSKMTCWDGRKPAISI